MLRKTKKIYYWACDISKNSGEGILANSFISNSSKELKAYTFINLNFKNKFQKKDKYSQNNKIYNSIYHKYVFPLIGILKLWNLFFKKKKVCYINYLPLWNFLLFLLLPPNTILGPITGTVRRKNFLFLFFDLMEIISLLIIKYRFNELYFSHNFYFFKYNLENNNYHKNYILKDFRFKKRKKLKKFDFIIYFRNHSYKHKKYFEEIIKKLNKKNYKFAIIGDNINIKGNKNFGYVSRKKAQSIISSSKFAIANPENLYSYFVQDCLSAHLIVFYNFDLKKYITFGKKYLVSIKFRSVLSDFKTMYNFVKNFK